MTSKINSIKRGLGLTKQEDLLFLINLHLDRISQEFFNRKDITVGSLTSSKLLGFSLFHPLRIVSQKSFENKKKAAENFDFSFLNASLRKEYNSNRSKIFFVSLKYDVNTELLYYNFMVFGVDKKTDDVLRLIF